jgi:transglutaminase-like putative cysteine protease
MSTSPYSWTNPNESEEQPRIHLSPSEGWTTVVLTLIMLLITVGCIENLQWTPGSGILTTTMLVGALLGFALAKQNFVPQWIADIPTLALGVFVAMVQTAMADDNGNLRELVHSLGIWVQGAFSGKSSNDSSIFLFFLAVLTMLLGYVSMWLIFRTRTPWLAVIANAVVLLINLNYTSDDKIVFAIFFLLIALILLVRCNLVARMRIWRQKGLRFPNEIGWDFMQAGVLFVVVIMLLGAFLPSGAVSVALSDAWNSPNGPWQSVQNSFGRLFHVSKSSNNLPLGFSGSLAIVGTVNLPDTISLTYATTDTTGAYLIGGTYDQYDGHQWTVGSTQSYSIQPNQVLSPETTDVTFVTQTVTVVRPPAGNTIFASDEPGSYSVPIVVTSDGVGLDSTDSVGSFVGWNATRPLHANQTYTATSYVSAATVKQLEAVPAPNANAAIQNNLYPAQLLKRYTELPADLTQQDPSANEVLLMAEQWTQGATNPFDAMQALANAFTRHGYAYSTTNPDPLPNQDAVETLLQTKSGYCTWYATAMTVMARELGMPARIAVGFTNDGYDQATKQYIVHGSDSHAWTQVYFPGYGWINFEPTPSFRPYFHPTSSSSGSGQSDVPPKNRPSPTTGQRPPTQNNTSTQTNAKPKSKQSGGVPTTVTISLGLLLALILSVALAVVLWWRLIYRRLSPIGQIFARMALLGRFAGVPPRRAQTATEYGVALATRFPEHREAIGGITQQYVEERWAPTPAESDASLLAHWRSVRDDLARIVARRVTQVRSWRRRRSQDL